MRILITGASGGLGSEFCRQFLSRGDEVLAVTRKSGPELEKIKLEYAGRIHVIQVDISKDDSLASLKAQLQAYPYLDWVINNAGTFEDEQNFEDEGLTDSIRASMEVNVYAPLRVLKATLPLLKKSATTPKVFQITSLMGSIEDNESGGYYSYRISKAGLNMLNKSFSIDFPELVSVVLHPGWVKTDMGGLAAPTLPKESVSGMIALMERLSLEESGRFYDFEGNELPW